MTLAAVSRAWPGSGPGPANAAAQRRTRIGYAASAEGDRWRRDMPLMAHAAVVADLADVRDGKLAAARFWVPYRALGATLDWVQRMGLQASVRDSAYDPGGLAVTAADARDPRTCITYALEMTAGGGHRDVPAPVPSCCAAASAGTFDALLLADGAGPLHACAALAPLGITPLRHVPCTLDCAASIAMVHASAERARALGLAELAASWERLLAIRPVATLRAGLMEVTMPGLRLAYPSAHRTVHPAAPAQKRWMLTPQLDRNLLLDTANDPAFTSQFARRSRFATILWEQELVLQRATGPIVHLGSGDGLMLELLGAVNTNVTLHGVQDNAAQWQTVLAASAPAAALLFDPMQLLALDAVSRRALITQMHLSAPALIAYATDTGLQQHANLTALAVAADLALVEGKQHRVSGRVQILDA